MTLSTNAFAQEDCEDLSGSPPGLYTATDEGATFIDKDGQRVEIGVGGAGFADQDEVKCIARVPEFMDWPCSTDAAKSRKFATYSIADLASESNKAAAIVHALGPFDVGQGAVVANGLVLAIEAAEGTDAMLDRCATLANGVAKGGVLVKRPKPGQELRIDLPVIGEAWDEGRELSLHGWMYEFHTGLLHDLGTSTSGPGEPLPV